MVHRTNSNGESSGRKQEANGVLHELIMNGSSRVVLSQDLQGHRKENKENIDMYMCAYTHMSPYQPGLTPKLSKSGIRSVTSGVRRR